MPPRTRSQPLSPSGLISLEDVSQRRYNTRNAARRRQPSQEKDFISKEENLGKSLAKKKGGRPKKDVAADDQHDENNPPISLVNVTDQAGDQVQNRDGEVRFKQVTKHTTEHASVQQTATSQGLGSEYDEERDITIMSRGTNRQSYAGLHQDSSQEHIANVQPSMAPVQFRKRPHLGMDDDSVARESKRKRLRTSSRHKRRPLSPSRTPSQAVRRMPMTDPRGRASRTRRIPNIPPQLYKQVPYYIRRERWQKRQLRQNEIGGSRSAAQIDHDTEAAGSGHQPAPIRTAGPSDDNLSLDAQEVPYEVTASDGSSSQEITPAVGRASSLSFRERLSGAFYDAITRVIPAFGSWSRTSLETLSQELPTEHGYDEPRTPVAERVTTERTSTLVGQENTLPEPSSDRLSRTVPSVPTYSRVSGKRPSRLCRTATNLNWTLDTPPRDRAMFGLPTTTEPEPEPVQTDSNTSPDIRQARETGPVSSESLDSRKSPVTKKRKRAPSPDVIPNPPGCSYGLDLDYFCYSSESDEDDVQTTEVLQPDHPSAETTEPAAKKARHEVNQLPTPTPIRRLPAATDPYRGSHFLLPGQKIRTSNFASHYPRRNAQLQVPKPPTVFIPNRQGTFRLDYDELSDDSDEQRTLSTPFETPALDRPCEESRAKSPEVTERSPFEPRPTEFAEPLPSFTPAKVDEEALAKARSLAEKYKPKTPSGLRTTSRYSSPLTAPSPDSVAIEPVEQDFGADEFARDAHWLYTNCPSGDLEKLVWPSAVDLQISLGLQVSSVLLSIDQKEMDQHYDAFRQALGNFEESLVESV